jgi:hypothetical protein
MEIDTDWPAQNFGLSIRVVRCFQCALPTTPLLHLVRVTDRFSLFISPLQSLSAFQSKVVLLFQPSFRENHCHLNMAPSAVSPAVALEQEDHARDAAFNKALHGKSSEVTGGLMAMRQKDKAAQKAAIDEYFKHWDNKEAKEETEEIRKARRDEYATLTRQYDLAH